LRHQQNKLYKDLELDGVMEPTAAEEHPQGRLLGEPEEMTNGIGSTRGGDQNRRKGSREGSLSWISA